MERKKIAVIGSGAIGTTIAYSLMLECSSVEISMINRSENKSWAKAFDISHCEPFLDGNTIYSESLEQCRGADILVMTAGALPKKNGTRADVLKDNIAIFKTLLPTLAANNPRAVILNITNPVDSMAYGIQRITGFPEGRVIGTGTELDTMRMRRFIGEHLGLAPDKISFHIIGEHGDSMVPLWSGGRYDGAPLFTGADGLGASKDELLHKTKRAGWDIREAGEHSCYAISYSAVRIIRAIVESTDSRLLVSSPFAGEYGIGNVFMSQLSILGSDGIEDRVVLDLSDDEQKALESSADIVWGQMKMVDSLL